MKRLLLVGLAGLLIVPSLALGARSAPRRELAVFAAASLTEFMRDAQTAFMEAHPDVTVRSNIAASSELRIQIQQGAPADVFLSADTANMTPLKQARLVEKPAIFAHNKLIIVVARRARNTITTPADLAKPGLMLSLAAPEAPVGRYSRQVLKKLDAKYGNSFFGKVEANVKSLEPTVKASLVKVVLGEADASIVYTSDVTPAVAKSVGVIRLPDELNVVAEYPIAVVTKSRNKAAARDFMAFVLSPRGKSLLSKNGLLP